ncbi:hypothetical protein WS80_12140 [Burkholderia pseudomultivorans]|nr:hypothetical protein WS80_12140 [Burkholderia pseudomultivorans]
MPACGVESIPELAKLRDGAHDWIEAPSGVARIGNVPRVHAVAMTQCGRSRQNKNRPDSSTQHFLQAALDIANKHADLFSEDDPANCFYLLGDFLSSSRISGTQRIPLEKLEAGQKFAVDG